MIERGAVAVLALKLVIYAYGAFWAVLGIRALPHPVSILYFLCAALIMRRMWRV